MVFGVRSIREFSTIFVGSYYEPLPWFMIYIYSVHAYVRVAMNMYAHVTVHSYKNAQICIYTYSYSHN